ncbi:uncharacterized protein LOC116250090 isoform X2 [Nymphaea colorata]|uniref:uncharacterized protein LOC116250090 isoform X2 n=1 Tax=Nymphaea colorata TaxID=210225 RepID=UPI00129D5BB7|nr:uncharacterized protein LOC116250090 isoform X2 [Nymphaea colorata]
MENPGPEGEVLCTTEAEEETSFLHKKRSRRVSFADTTSVHVFDRDEDFETPPDPKPNSDNPEGLKQVPQAGKASTEKEAGGDDDDSREANGNCDAEDIERFVLEMQSPGSANGSATSNEEDKFFGPVSTSFIRSRALLDSPAADDITLDSTAFSMQFAKLLHSREITKTSSGFCLTSDCEKTPTEDSSFITSGNRMVLTNDKKVENNPSSTSPNLDADTICNEMSLVVDEPKKYDYTRFSPRSNALLVDYYKYFPTSPCQLPEGNNQLNGSVDSSIKADPKYTDDSEKVKSISSRSQEVDGSKLHHIDHNNPFMHTPIVKSLGTGGPSFETLPQINTAPENSGNHIDTVGVVAEANQSRKKSSDVNSGVCLDVMGLMDQELQRNEHEDLVAARGKISSQLSSPSPISHVLPFQSTNRKGYLHSLVNDENLKSEYSGSASMATADLSSGRKKIIFPEQEDEAVLSSGKSASSLASKTEHSHQMPRNFVDHQTLDEPEDNFLRLTRVIHSPDSGMRSPISSPKLNWESETPLSRMSSLFGSGKHFLLSNTFSPSCNIEISTPFLDKATREHTDDRLKLTEGKKVTTPYPMLTSSYRKYGPNHSTPELTFSGPDHPIKVVQKELNEGSLPNNIDPSNTSTESYPMELEPENKQLQDRPGSNCPELLEEKLESLSGQFIKKNSLINTDQNMATTPVSCPSEAPRYMQQLSSLGNSSTSLRVSDGHSNLDMSKDGLGKVTRLFDFSEEQKCAVDVGHCQTIPSSHGSSCHDLSLRDEDMVSTFVAEPNLSNLKALNVRRQSPCTTPESRKRIALPTLSRKSSVSQLQVDDLHGDSIPSVNTMSSLHEFDGTGRKRKKVEVLNAETSYKKTNSEGVLVGQVNQSKELSHSSEDHASYNRGRRKVGNGTTTRLVNCGSSLSDVFGMQSFPISRMRYKDLHQLEDMLEELQKVIKYRRLSSKFQPQKVQGQMESSKHQRIVEARLLWLELVYEHLKFQITQMKSNMLQKNKEQLQLGVQECHRLKLNPLRNPSALVPNAQIKESQGQSPSVHKVKFLRQELSALDQKMKNLAESLHKHCKIKGSPDPDETLLLVNDYVNKKICCTQIQQDLQLWKLDNIDTSHDKHTIVLKYGGFLSQRLSIDFSGASSSVQAMYSIHNSDINMIFPSMNACMAFSFVFGVDHVRTLQGPTCVQQEAQVAGHLLGNLLDVLEEVQLARMHIPYLLRANFDCPAAGKLELCLFFIDYNMEQKATVVLNVTELKRAVYPFDVIPSKLHIQSSGVPRSESLIYSEMMHAIQKLKFGNSRISRICRVVSQQLGKSNG